MLSYNKPEHRRYLNPIRSIRLHCFNVIWDVLVYGFSQHADTAVNSRLDVFNSANYHTGSPLLYGIKIRQPKTISGSMTV